MLPQNKLDFLNQCIEIAKRVKNEDGAPIISGQVAQAVLEGAWGEHIPGNNTFGIKAHNCPFVEGSDCIGTHEYYHGVEKFENDKFSTYVDLYHCFKCHSLLLKQNYPTAYSAKEYMNYIEALHHDPVTGLSYATDPNYVRDFISVVKSHNLDRLDI